MWSSNIHPHYNVSHTEYESPSLVSEEEMILMRNFVILLKIRKLKSYEYIK
jgi:hypothetical protein